MFSSHMNRKNPDQSPKNLLHHLPADATAVLEAIRRDRQQGASALARLAVKGIATGVLSSSRLGRDDLTALAAPFAFVRPGMLAITRAVSELVFRAHHIAGGEKDPGAALLRAAHGVMAWLNRASLQVPETAGTVLREFRCVATLSRSSTAIQTLSIWAAAGEKSVFVTLSHPPGEGAATARALAEAGARVTLIPDAMIYHAIERVDAAVVGADSILADGSFVNKTGSHLMAAACRELGKPLYVVAESCKLASAGISKMLVLEEMDPAEVTQKEEAGIEVKNIYFETTPAELVTAYITEEGIFTPDQMADMAKEISKKLDPVLEELASILKKTAKKE